MTPRLRRAGVAVAVLALTTTLATVVPAAGAPTQAPARTAAVVRASTAAVPTPRLGWYPCFGKAQCTTVKAPLDYDRPAGIKVELALLRLKARRPAQRLGSLFVNPGGPGGSATELAYFSDEILSPDVLDRFDIVGMDPRGIGFSDNVQCFPSMREQTPALAGYTKAFPTTPAAEQAWLRSDRAEGRACSRNLLAFSYGTYLLKGGCPRSAPSAWATCSPSTPATRSSPPTAPARRRCWPGSPRRRASSAGAPVAFRTHCVRNAP